MSGDQPKRDFQWDDDGVRKGPDARDASADLDDIAGEWRGSAYTGRSFWFRFAFPWPTARLKVAQSGIVVEVPGGSYVLPRSHIQRFDIEREFPRAGLRIEHTVDRYDDYLVFWKWNLREIVATLESLGYCVGDHG